MPQSLGIQLGWIDYSNEHKKKVLTVLDALSAPEAVDELGIGIVRDGFANILFPGTSTIQTRAKYFFIVPYILMELEKEKNLNPEKLLSKLVDIEIDLIEVLAQQSKDGVIGKRAGKKLKRKPSSIYWNGLRMYGIFKHPSLSIEGYAKAVTTLKREELSLINSGFQDSEKDSDDSDVTMGTGTGSFWRCLLPEENWKNTLTMDLTYNEAQYLKERIIKSPLSKDSLFSYVLKNCADKVIEIADFDAIGKTIDLPLTIKEDYELARKFSNFIYGANIRYNVILSKGENREAESAWEEWYNSNFVRNNFQDFNYMEVNQRLELKNLRLISFLRNWYEAVLNGSLDEIDSLIIAREIELKSKERAKLNNSQVYDWKGKEWLGGKLQYRFKNTSRLIEDIVKGLKGDNV
ncbi:DUF6361 family protein [Salipaludibacillus sp. CUR1]|uniref:DUF6361 family protein n=1 Tax=Salipaludibacillus sp. CUR1 TaxID=2820003 RepID=UPI001E2B141D|nr:DUF6361 family protein [Salipaludibacillus sp. CUR1]MCE7792204.1 DUF6361 family protein [Salipaludibacillus sp. CUR1]